MGIINTLKWLWDPRDEEQKRYETDPLRLYTQEIYIYIKDINTPFKRFIEFEDVKCGDFFLRVDLDDELSRWLSNRASKGIQIENVWYAPESIDRIEIGKHTVVEM